MLKKLLVVFLMFALIVGCSNENQANNNSGGNRGMDGSPVMDKAEESFGVSFNSDMDMDDDSDVALTFSESEQYDNNQNESQRKIIKSGYLVMETLNYDKAIESLQDAVNAYNGYIESSNIGGKRIHAVNQTRHAYFTLRIPEVAYSDFVEEVNTIGYVITQQTNAQDITSNYFDTDARVRTLEVQEERLLDILRRAEEIEDVIALEKELSSVRYEIESLTQTLRRWDQQVTYATLEVTIEEVYEIKEEKEVAISLSEKIKAGFENTLDNIGDFFENLTINFVSFLPYLILIIPGLLILWWMIRRIRRGYTAHSQEIKTKDEIEHKE